MGMISEARKRGYRKGMPIRYVPHAVDYVIGDYFQEEDGKVNAYLKPPHERECFEDFTHDTLFDGFKWVEIVDLSNRSQEQIELDNIHNIN